MRSILVIAPDPDPWEVEYLEELLYAELKKWFRIVFADSTLAAMKQDWKQFHAILVTNANITGPKRVSLNKRLVHFASTSEKKVIFCGLFSSLMRFPDFDELMKNIWKLDWKFGRFHGNTYTKVVKNQVPFNLTNIDEEFTTKALSLYNATPQSQLFKVDPSDTDSPVIMQRYGKGHVGYLGDVNQVKTTLDILVCILNAPCLKAVYGPLGYGGKLGFTIVYTRTTDLFQEGMFQLMIIPDDVVIDLLGESGAAHDQIEFLEGEKADKLLAYYRETCTTCLQKAESIKKCSKCGIIFYCSRACQISDWQTHRHRCPLYQAGSLSE